MAKIRNLLGTTQCFNSINACLLPGEAAELNLSSFELERRIEAGLIEIVKSDDKKKKEGN